MWYTVGSEVGGYYQDRGSRFNGVLFRCNDHESFEKKLDDIRKVYTDATHHCYAGRTGLDPTNEFVSDAGEPAGTAGLPILNRLRSFRVVNCGLVVIRYFGGIKLGKPGLIRAYGTTAQLCLEKARLPELVASVTIEVTYPYNQSRPVKQWVQKWGAVVQDSQYLEMVTETIALPLSSKDDAAEELERMEYLGVRVQIGGTGWIIREHGG